MRNWCEKRWTFRASNNNRFWFDNNTRRDHGDATKQQTLLAKITNTSNTTHILIFKHQSTTCSIHIEEMQPRIGVYYVVINYDYVQTVWWRRCHELKTLKLRYVSAVGVEVWNTLSIMKDGFSPKIWIDQTLWCVYRNIHVCAKWQGQQKLLDNLPMC